MEIDLDPEQTEWDAYVAGNSGSLFSHLYGWAEALALTCDLPVFRLAARNGHGRITGALPLILFSPPGSDKRLISLPFTDAAGILADGQDVFQALLNAAMELAVEHGAVHLELRQAGNASFPDPPQAGKAGFSHTPHAFKTGLTRELPSSSDMLWRSLEAKVRNQVRKARRCGCIARTGGRELVRDFYSVFSENMRDLGSPVHAHDLFERVMEALPAGIIVIDVDEIPVAAAMVFRHHFTLSTPWASSLRRFRPLCPNMLLYWTMLAYGADNGCRRFDFGRSSPGAATCAFKLQWGAGMEPLVWHVVSRDPCRWDPRQESLVDDAWKQMDLEASRRQGPAVRRRISL
jgi:FemAB-related protein (PEP-CTERM system-associated)